MPLLLTTMSLMAQSNLILFSENGEQFYVVLNGIIQNEKPETNVKITDLRAPSYKVKVIFDYENLGEIEKTIYMNENAHEYTYIIKKKNTGEYIVRFMNMVPIALSMESNEVQHVIPYTSTPAITTIVHTESITTTTGQPAGISIDANVNQNGVNMNVNLNSQTNSSSSVSTYTSTTTTTTTSNTPAQHHGHHPHEEVVVVYVPGYAGEIGCPVPMSDIDFNEAMKAIESKSFEDSKLTIAKQIIMSNCITSRQVKKIMKLFDFEDSRLEFAKFAYGRTYDQGNYFLINDAFTFESSIDELNDYILGQ